MKPWNTPCRVLTPGVGVVFNEHTSSEYPQLKAKEQAGVACGKISSLPTMCYLG